VSARELRYAAMAWASVQPPVTPPCYPVRVTPKPYKCAGYTPARLLHLRASRPLHANAAFKPRARRVAGWDWYMSLHPPPGRRPCRRGDQIRRLARAIR